MPDGHHHVFSLRFFYASFILITILFIAFIFQIGHVLYAGASTTIPVEVETVNKLFTNIVTDTVFQEEWDRCFAESTNSFFRKHIPSPIQKYTEKISFTGEFIRFLRDKIIDPNKNISTFTVFQINNNTWSSTFINSQVKRNSEYIINDDLPVFFILVALDNVRRYKNDLTWGANVEHRYYFVGGIIQKDGIVKIELCDFLTNINLPLSNKVQKLENISEEIMSDFRNWLLNQEKKYILL